MKRHRTERPMPFLMPIGHLLYLCVLPFERMFEFIFEFELVFMFELVWLAFDIGVDIGVEIGVAIGVEVVIFVFTRFVLLVVLFAAPPQAMPRAASDNIAVSAIRFIKILDLRLLKVGNVG